MQLRLGVHASRVPPAASPIGFTFRQNSFLAAHLFFAIVNMRVAEKSNIEYSAIEL
jgi:hypothetical protein